MAKSKPVAAEEPKKPKWAKVVELHKAGKIDLAKLLSERGYGQNTIVEVFKKEFDDVVVYQDWMKGYKETFGEFEGKTRSPKSKESSIDFGTIVKLKKKIEEFGGQKKVDGMIENVSYLADLAGGMEQLLLAIKLMEQYDNPM